MGAYWENMAVRVKNVQFFLNPSDFSQFIRLKFLNNKPKLFSAIFTVKREALLFSEHGNDTLNNAKIRLS